MPTTPSATPEATRRFEFEGGTSHKFWEVSLHGAEVTVCFGRIGTAGQTLRKSFPEVPQAERHVEQLIREKTAKGYVEIGGR